MRDFKSTRLMEIQLEEAESIMRRVLGYTEELNQHIKLKKEFDPEAIKLICSVTRTVHMYFVEYYFEDEH